MSIKVRTGQISIDLRDEALRSFATFRGGMILLPVKPNDFRIAARFSEHHETGIRANDALHLAVAHEYGATLCTLDRRLAKAGPQLGVAAELIA
jgi:predicted nucleic acid-binding protein